MKKNLISTLMEGKLDTALQLLTRKGKRFKPWVVMVVMFAGFLTQSKGQNMCGFDEKFQPVYNSNQQYFDDQEKDLQKAIVLFKKNGGGPVVIPVIFHIIHNGEPIGTYGNIYESQIIAALASLNHDFKDYNISFCRAKRDPFGLPLAEEGIQRIDASVSGYTGTLTSNNEATIKGLSYFTNYRYLNIWVVSNIVLASGPAFGFATFPKSSPSEMDGIVMNKDFLGNGHNILTHEVGHFLDLYHTFQGDCPPGVNCNVNNCSATICPPPYVMCDTDPLNDDMEICCRNQGDNVCDTPPHKRSCLTCVESGNNECDNNTSNLVFLKNHMNYSTCRTTFTEGQVTRMMGCLMSSRAGLGNSLGCLPSCSPFFSIYFPSNSVYKLSEEVTFNGYVAPTSNVTFSWFLNDLWLSNDQNLTYTFQKSGIFNLCLRGTDSNGCINEDCHTIEVLSNEACNMNSNDDCELLKNGDFAQYNGEYFIQNFIDFPTMPIGLQSDRVCNVLRINGTPSLFTSFFNNNQGNFEIMSLASSNSTVAETQDVIAFGDPLNLEDGEWYNLTFKYGVAAELSTVSLNKFKILLVENYFDLNGEILYEEEDVQVTTILNPGFAFNLPFEKNIRFQYNENWGNFLKIDVDFQFPITALIIGDLHLTRCCTPNPQISVDQINDCKFKFTFDKGSDKGVMYWTIDGGPEGTTTEATYSFSGPGVYEVCLYVTCDEGVTNHSECITVDARNCISNCGDFIVPISGVKQCGETATQVQFTLSPPEGFHPCRENLYVTPTALVNSSNYYFDDNTNELMVSMSIDDPSTVYTMVLCGPNGESICYQLALTTGSISNCSCPENPPIYATATCNDTNLTDMNFSYSGSFSITPPPNAELCGGTSSSGGYSQGSPASSGGTYTIPFDINTNNPNPFNTEAIVCFNVNGIIQCYKVIVSIETPCEIEPCIQEMHPVILKCEGENSSTANVVFRDLLFFKKLALLGFELCNESNAFTNIGTVTIPPGNGSNTEVFISIPCEDLASTNQVNLTLYFCNDENRVICITLNLDIDCPNCGGRSDGRTKQGELISDSYSLYPNPTLENIVIEANNKSNNQVLTINNMYGKKIEIVKINSGTNTINLSQYANGIYTFDINDGLNSVSKKVIIIK